MRGQCHSHNNPFRQRNVLNEARHGEYLKEAFNGMTEMELEGKFKILVAGDQYVTSYQQG